MKKLCLFFITVILCLSLTLSCNSSPSAPQYGSLSATIVDANLRTIEPAASDITITQHKILGQHQNATSFEEEVMDSNPYTKTGLIVGTWSITVNGYNADSVLIATKTQNVVISKDSTTESSFNLDYLSDGTGTYKVVFSVDSSNTNLSKITYTLTPASGGSAVDSGTLTTYTTVGEKHNYTIGPKTVDTGIYNLVAVFKNSNDAVLYTYGPEIVRIYKGLESSGTVDIGGQYTPMVSKPVISPNGGDYTESVDIGITCSTSGATIYYTLDGSTPTSSSAEYSGEFSITQNVNCIKAIAYKEGMTSSEVASSSPFNISVGTPTISPDGGSYSNPQAVTISCTTSGATIYYTTNGDEPTTSSTKYSGSFNLAKNGAIVKAIATKSNMENSTAATSSSFSFKVATPVVSPD